MTRKAMIEAILDDMKARQSTYDKEDLDRKWRPWLNRQSKSELEFILNNRMKWGGAKQ